MKAVILAGGFGTRISEESGVRPKPMVEICGKPILWHVMKIYSKHGINDFIILCGYKSNIIKEYFASYALYKSDVTFDFKNNTFQIHKNGVENWRVTLVETGEETMTGGRLKKAASYIGNETFCLTYGDGVSDVNISEVVRIHNGSKAMVTMTTVQPPGRFGVFTLKGNSNKVKSFKEKPDGDGAWINGGFFVVEPEALSYIDEDETVWEQEPLQKIAEVGGLVAYKHTGFWQCMDTLRDRNVLEKIWQTGRVPWKVWE